MCKKITIEDLKQYRYLIDEIKDIKAEISVLSNNQSVDVVKASYDEFPYTEHSVTVKGLNKATANKKQKLINKKQRKLQELEELKNRINEFIDNIPDRRVRNIIILKYIKGYSWQRTASLIGGNNTADSCRKALSRYMKRIIY